MKRKKAVTLWILNIVVWVSIFISWLHQALKFIFGNRISPKNANVLDWSQPTWFTVWKEQRKIHRVISVDGLRIKAQLLGSKKEPAQPRDPSVLPKERTGSWIQDAVINGFYSAGSLECITKTRNGNRNVFRRKKALSPICGCWGSIMGCSPKGSYAKGVALVWWAIGRWWFVRVQASPVR